MTDFVAGEPSSLIFMSEESAPGLGLLAFDSGS